MVCVLILTVNCLNLNILFLKKDIKDEARKSELPPNAMTIPNREFLSRAVGEYPEILKHTHTHTHTHTHCENQGLPYKAGETLYVTRMTACPTGHWECRNASNEVGYVWSKGE